MYFGPFDLVAALFADQQGRQNALPWARGGVDRHRPGAATPAGNQYALCVRGHALGLQAQPARPSRTMLGGAALNPDRAILRWLSVRSIGGKVQRGRRSQIQTGCCLNPNLMGSADGEPTTKTGVGSLRGQLQWRIDPSTRRTSVSSSALSPLAH
jgi:hypothetical protein